MQFNSISYLIFLPITFILYWFIFRKRRAQNWLLIAASYFFYASWNWRFAFLIAFTTLCSYFSGILIEKTLSVDKRRAKIVNTVNIVINVGILCYFKYFNFFIDSFINLVNVIGWRIDIPTARIVLPVGISFYTFQAIGYTIDVKRRRIKASNDIVSFFTYICFFPQLVAGPIERAKNLLPQFQNERKFDYHQAIDGIYQMLWGFAKKLIIADNCARYLDPIFQNPSLYSSSDLILGLLLFFLQIYGDFSGYSDIAIGSAKLFGIRLTKNFNAPMYSRNIAEFWRKWHISLNSWFFDYIFYEMKGWNKKWRIALNIVFVFLLSGLWHGADFKYILWGLYFGLWTIPSFLKFKPMSPAEVANGKLCPSLKEVFQMLSTFIIVLFGGALFRSPSISGAFVYYKSIITNISLDGYVDMRSSLYFFTIAMFVLEWIFRGKEHPFQLDAIVNKPARFALIAFAVFCIFWFSYPTTKFIYFDF